jgi:uncharacterized membrane protein
MERTLESLKSVLTEQFQASVERKNDYEDDYSSGSSTPENFGIQNRQAIAQLAKAIAKVQGALLEEGYVKVAGGAEEQMSPQEETLWEVFEDSVEKSSDYEDDYSSGSSTPQNFGIQNRQAIAQLAEAILETRKADAAENRQENGIKLPGKPSAKDSHPL